MLKVTLPEQDDFYADCVRHPKVVQVVALSGGYTQKEANAKLQLNQTMRTSVHAIRPPTRTEEVP
jgi:fructose-bisphosphate aldolase class I